MVVRRHNKRGNAYYFNKSTGKRTSKRAWKISLSHRQEKPSYRTRKVDGHSIKVRLGKVRKGISYQKVSALKKQRSNLYANRYYWNNKLSELIKKQGKKKEINKAKRRLSGIVADIIKINRKLGIVYVVKPPPKEGERIEIGKKIFSITFVHWQGKQELEDLLKKDYFKNYEVEGEMFSKDMPADIMMEYESQVQIGFEYSSTPHMTFVYDDKRKLVRIFLEKQQ